MSHPQGRRRIPVHGRRPSPGAWIGMTRVPTGNFVAPAPDSTTVPADSDIGTSGRAILGLYCPATTRRSLQFKDTAAQTQEPEQPNGVLLVGGCRGDRI
ncbi:hypothetical protein GCM10010269_77120 [Streptomyces humidus]|uniref:Uncharacterized protein n=1 Tax=Streptomyces humidus TaxID=52259 RepID=A0A918GBB4_9ACTN|nr:hypothetical protein GCM10010269_77120 [Streptomyces humidus]